MYTWEQFQAAYQAANTEIRNMIDTETIPNQVTSLLPQLNAQQQRLVIKAVSGYILQILPMDQLEVTLQQQGIRIDENILSKITLGAASVTETVSPVRTMASDMQTVRNEQTFASSQDALLQRNSQPTAPGDARWKQTN